MVLEKAQGVEGVTDRGGLGDAEHGRQAERVAAAGEGFFELPVDAQSFQGRGLAAQVKDPGGAELREVDAAQRRATVDEE